METKICTKCEQEKTIKEFHWADKKKNYRRPDCRNCKNKHTKKWRADNPEYNKEYHQNHKKKRNAYSKQWSKDNREKCNKQVKRWRKNNLKYFKEYIEWYRRKNKKHIQEYSKQYNKNNPDKMNAWSAKRRARKLNQTPIGVDMDKIKQIYAISSFMSSISVNCNWHVDHIYPISKGGLHHQDNLQILDSVANMKKSNKLLN